MVYAVDQTIRYDGGGPASENGGTVFHVHSGSSATELTEAFNAIPFAGLPDGIAPARLHFRAWPFCDSPTGRCYGPAFDAVAALDEVGFNEVPDGCCVPLKSWTPDKTVNGARGEAPSRRGTEWREHEARSAESSRNAVPRRPPAGVAPTAWEGASSIR